MTTALYLLRCTEMGLSLRDLDLLEIGTVFDMFTEKSNDNWDGWSRVATQEDFNKF